MSKSTDTVANRLFPGKEYGHNAQCHCCPPEGEMVGMSLELDCQKMIKIPIANEFDSRLGYRCRILDALSRT